MKLSCSVTLTFSAHTCVSFTSKQFISYIMPLHCTHFDIDCYHVVLTVQVLSLLPGRFTHYYHYHNTIIRFMIIASTLSHATNSDLYSGDDPFESHPRLEYLYLFFVIFFSPCRSGLAKLWHVCPKWHA
jgi:hypothetical protein